VVKFTPRSLYPRGKSPRCVLDRWLGGPHSRSEQHGEVKILDHSVVQAVASRYTDCAVFKGYIAPETTFSICHHHRDSIFSMVISRLWRTLRCLVRLGQWYNDGSNIITTFRVCYEFYQAFIVQPYQTSTELLRTSYRQSLRDPPAK
jgi:hypothetical protein